MSASQGEREGESERERERAREIWCLEQTRTYMLDSKACNNENDNYNRVLGLL